jgi:hypothetical protein
MDASGGGNKVAGKMSRIPSLHKRHSTDMFLGSGKGHEITEDKTAK